MASEAPRISQLKEKRTACFVHKLLENERREKKAWAANGMDGIVEERKHEKGLDARQEQVHSRLLTKKQLSDMAWGVRELSKRLGGIRLKLKVKTVFLLTKAHDEELIWKTREVAEWLLSKERDVPYIVYVYRW